MADSESTAVFMNVPVVYLSLYHVDAPRAQSLDTVVDVHHSLTLCHVQHNVQDNITTCPPSAHAADRTTNPG